MASPEIPGFYYDEAKKKYFKILPNHVAPQGSHYSKDAVRKEAESKLLQKKADKSNLRRQQTRVQHSQILEHPFGGRISLQREFGVLNALMRDNTMSWALGLRKKDRFSTGFPLSCFVRDDATGSLVCATSFNGRDAVM